jgi:predicted NACHT family NTPase
MRLQQVFLELKSSLPQIDDTTQSNERSTTFRAAATFAGHYRTQTGSKDGILPTTAFMLSEGAERVVLVGGPGEGKSTVGQYLAQLHRAVIIGKSDEIAQNKHYSMLLPRLPFRVILREFGQWLSRLGLAENTESSVEQFICEEIKRATSRTLKPEQLHNVLRENPSLLILDGLDEVTDAELQKKLLSAIDDFVDRVGRVVGANMQIFATTRPTSYNNQFNSKDYVHLRLVPLEPLQVQEYVHRWAIARNLDHGKADRLRTVIEDCLFDH